MTEYVPPENPLPVPDRFKDIVCGLLNAVVETLAFIGQPVHGEMPSHLIMHTAHQWAIRMTMCGEADASHATVWELSNWIGRMAREGIPFPPYDITSKCGEDDCKVDHGVQTRVINDLFASAHGGRPQDAVKSYARYVALSEPDEWTEARGQYLAMLLVHTAGRVCEYRSSATPDLSDLLIEDPED
jgi:hypothetical protein